MKFYIATSTARARFHNVVRNRLTELGHEITCDWTSHGSIRETGVAKMREVAQTMSKGVELADFIVVLLPGGKGTHTELGMSLGKDKRVFIHSEDPTAFESNPEACAFYHRSDVVQLTGPLEQVADAVHALLVMNL